LYTRYYVPGRLYMSDQYEEIKQWIIKADHDLGTAMITYLHIPEYLDTVTFHCQQAVEKYFKAYLIFQGSTFRFSHDLVYLLDLITQKDSDFTGYYDRVSELQGYAVELRYPNETIFLSDEIIDKVMLLSKDVREFVTHKMKIVVPYHDILDQG
jgi:HEPN domain-containing protein